VFQDVVFTVMREFLVFCLHLTPHMRDTLCRMSPWAGWERSVIDGCDALRHLTYSRHMAPHTILPAALAGAFDAVGSAASKPLVPRVLLHGADLERVRPLIRNTLYDVPRPHAFSLLLHALQSRVLDVDGITETAAVDGVLSPEREVYLRGLLHQSACEPAARAGRTERLLLDAWGITPGALALLAAGCERVSQAAGGDREAAAGFWLALARDHGMLQFQLVAALLRAITDWARICVSPLPAHIALLQAQALRQRYGLRASDPLPRHPLRVFACWRCRRFCSYVVGDAGSKKKPKKAQDAQPHPDIIEWETATGTRNVAFADDCLEWRAEGPAGRAACQPAPSLLSVYASAAHAAGEPDDGDDDDTVPMFSAAFAGADGDMPPDPALDTAKHTGSVREAQGWRQRQEQRELLGAGAFAQIAEQAKSALPPAPDPLSPERVRWLRQLGPWGIPRGARGSAEFESAEACDAAELEFRALWGDRTVGHAPPPGSGERQVLWVCASKRARNEHKKIKSAAGGRQHHDPVKYRRAIRCRYEYGLCRQTRLLEVDLLGAALWIDGRCYLACCRCLGNTLLAKAAWHGAGIVCPRCDAALTAAPRGAPCSGVGNGLFTCRRCHALQVRGDFCALLAYDDLTPLGTASQRLVTVHFCPAHVDKVLWAWQTPNILPLSVVDRGPAGGGNKWRAPSRWSAHQAYLRAYADEEEDEK